MTELLYLTDHAGIYTSEFEATVTATADGLVELDRTAFYPLGGGQPSDTGTLHWEGGEATVREVRKRHRVRHFIAGGLPPVGTRVTGVLDWEQRFAHMRMHTAQHVVSALVDELHQARTVGNQIGAERSRIDFEPLRLDAAQVAELEVAVNEALVRDTPVHITERDRAELEGNPLVRANLDLLPPHINRLRVITIGTLDICPCAGTHVQRLGEIGQVRFVKRDNKGRGKQRLTYKLV